MSCDRFELLLQWRDTDQMDRVDTHLQTCGACADAWHALDELTLLGQALPTGLPAPRQVESVRTALLTQSAPAPERAETSRGWIALAAALVLAIGGWLLWPQPSALGRIDGRDATYAVERAGNAEHVWLSEGSLAIEVAHLGTEQRFVVHTDDAEIEVRGTRFTVHAEAGRLQAVEVQAGRVEVRPRIGKTVLLNPTEAWRAPKRSAAMTAPESAVPVPTTTAPSIAPPPAPLVDPIAPATQAPDTVARTAKRRRPHRRSRPKPVTQPSNTVPPTTAPSIAPASTPIAPAQPTDFQTGWSALQAGAYAKAIPAFEAAMQAGGPLAQDARWWHAVALGRAGREGAMRKALRRFITRYPGAARAPEAQVMLGWSLFAAGQIDAADAAFDAGAKAGRPAARQSARKGRQAVQNWRAQRQK